jgi:hypothetical protein
MVKRAILIAVAGLAMASPAAASAAQVVNGGFESGLAGWEVRRLTRAGNWYAYEGTKPPIEKQRADQVQAPPQGDSAAIADQINRDTLFLFQNIQLEPDSSYDLSLLAFYDSLTALAIPSPDTLSVDEEAIGDQANQQFRIDLMRPDAPVDSVAPGDVLHTLFRTKAGGPRTLKPTRFSADLTPFAGQAVRLRIAVAATKEVFYAGVDAISLSPGKRGKGGIRTVGPLGIGRAKVNTRGGIVRLPVRVPSAGRLTSIDPSGKVRTASKGVGEAKTLVLPLRPTKRGRKILERRQRMRVEIRLRWTASDGSPEVFRVPVLFRLKNS